MFKEELAIWQVDSSCGVIDFGTLNEEFNLERLEVSSHCSIRMHRVFQNSIFDIFTTFFKVF